jgi:hypothetical protein
MQKLRCNGNLYKMQLKNLCVNSAGCNVYFRLVTCYYSLADFSFFSHRASSIASQILHDGICLHDLSIHIFFEILDAHMKVLPYLVIR